MFANPKPQTRGGRLSFGLCAAAVGLLFSGFCFLKAMPGSLLRAETVSESGRNEWRDEKSTRLGYRTRNIEDLRVGDRVLADNPDIDSPSESQVDAATWRKLRLRMEETWDDGTVDDINVETLQPLEWIEAVNARTGSTVPIPVDLVEMGLAEDLQVEVIAIEPCPALKPGEGRIVLTTINHLNNYVLELMIRSADGRIVTTRPTGLHKFYRASDGAWMSAEDLRAGDSLRGVYELFNVVSIRRVPGTHRVYNMTVEGEHAYNVTSSGILVHNPGCGPGGGGTRPRPQRPRPQPSNQVRPDLEQLENRPMPGPDLTTAPPPPRRAKAPPPAAYVAPAAGS